MPVDPQSSGKLPDGTQTLVERIDGFNALVMTQAHGRFREPNKRKHLFIVTNTAAQAFSVALATTYTGLYLYNPPGSGVSLSIVAAGLAATVAPTGIASIHLGGGFASGGGITTETSQITPFSATIGETSAALAHAGYAATIAGTPKYVLPLKTGNTGSALPAAGQELVMIDGMVEVLPGGYVMLVALTAVTGFGGFVWEELPL